jgi:D-beta-D-heptose 7-phosphate kinase/D-beta-D-heptose 1-phosphate adenosyltransferase
MAGQTQLVRIDEESTDPLNKAIEDEVISLIRYEMARTDIVIIQDYGKGVITRRVMDEVHKLAEKYDLGVLVDPYSKRDPSVYAGADVLTPNKQECMELVSDLKPESIEQATNYLLGATGAWGVLTTLGKDGMYGVHKFAPSFTLKSEAQNVVDVTGAGDTVISALAIGMAMGLEFQNAASMANHAAAIVVKKLGTSVCTKDELLKSLQERT